MNDCHPVHWALVKLTMCKQFSDAHTSTFAQETAAQYLNAGRMPGTLDNLRKHGYRASVMGEALSRELGDAVEFNPKAACSSGSGSAARAGM